MKKRLLSGVLAVVLALSPLGVMGVHAAETESTVVVNPLYESMISEEEAQETIDSAVKAQEALPQAYSEVPEYSTVEEAADYVRERMKERQSAISIVFLADSDDGQIIDDIFYEAVKHTGNPLEGDYLFWQYQSRNCRYSVQQQGSQWRFELNYTVIFNTTAEQEVEMTEAVNALLAELNLTEKSNLEKIRTIYDWVCENVRYDFYGNDMTKFTGYGALINRAAVCQGYSLLLYRLMLESGVDCRIIRGDASLNHSWNIVQLDDGYYYNVDATWDEGREDYYNYLKTNEEFAQRHPRDPQYMTEEFLTKYPSASMPDVLTYAESETNINIIGCQKDVAGELVIPEGIRGKAVTEIYDNAFSGCENLTAIRLPKTITKIWDGAFSQCGSLTDVYYDGTKEMWNAVMIAEGNDDLLSAVIHCTDGDIEKIEEYVVTANGVEVARGPYNTKVVMPAPTVPEEQKFIGWREVGTETILSTKEAYTFYISRSIALEPVFAGLEDEVEETLEALMSDVKVTKRADGRSDIKFVGQLIIPEGYTLEDAGLVWSPSDNAELVLDNGIAKVTHIKKISDTCQFSVTIKGVPEGRSVRGKIFATVQKEDALTIYSAEEKVFATQ